jgi:hypothetical protein
MVMQTKAQKWRALCNRAAEIVRVVAMQDAGLHKRCDQWLLDLADLSMWDPADSRSDLVITRDDLVRFVQSVIGEANGASYARTMNVSLWPGVRGLRLTFMVGHTQVVGVYVMPLPPGVPGQIADKAFNPYNAMSVKAEAVSDESLPAQQWGRA